MTRSRRSVVWWVIAALSSGALVVLTIDLSEQRHLAAMHANDYVTALFGGETGRALMEHPLSVTAWRMNSPGAHVVTPSAADVTALVQLLRDPKTYNQSGPVGQRLAGLLHMQPGALRADATVRFDNEQGSLNVMVFPNGSAIDILRDGSRISQANTVPGQERLSALLRQILSVKTPAAVH